METHFGSEVFHCQCRTKAFIDFKSLQFLGRHLPPRNYASFVPVISILLSLEEDHNCQRELVNLKKVTEGLSPQ